MTVETLNAQATDLPDLTDLLACPSCKVKLAMVRGELKCIACQSRYPILEGGIVSFTGDLDAGFDHRWAMHPKPQKTTDGVFEQKTGWTGRRLAGQTVLDAGCGCGRFTREALLQGAKVVAMDVSVHGLRATIQNAPEGLRENLLPVQASLLNPPLREGCLDSAFSIGVLHHTSDPAAAFLAISRAVGSGGEIAVWVYSKPTDDRWLPAMELLHEITKACPPEALHAAFKKHALQVRESYAGEWSPLAQILRISNSPDPEECISDTFDWHTPQYRTWHTADEVQEWFTAAGIDVTRIGDFPVSVSGTKK
uniref:Putative methyltransferase n=1 Tax=viral metagenome TaxID=1070528 RepID=A0A6H1Z8Y5_9ZZZZ